MIISWVKPRVALFISWQALPDKANRRVCKWREGIKSYYKSIWQFFWFLIKSVLKIFNGLNKYLIEEVYHLLTWKPYMTSMCCYGQHCISEFVAYWWQEFISLIIRHFTKQILNSFYIRIFLAGNTKFCKNLFQFICCCVSWQTVGACYSSLWWMKL